MSERLYGIPVERIWYWDGQQALEPAPCAQLLRYLRLTPEAAHMLKGFRSIDRADTLVSDLTQCEDEIFGKMDRTFRYHIRRAQKESPELSVYRAEDISRDESILAEFRTAYMHFCDAAGNQQLKKGYSADRIRALIETDGLILTRGIIGNAKVFHLYVTDGRTAVMRYSASDFRDAEVDNALAGRLNKLLHWNDMCYFKSTGYQYYDWGNVSTANREEYNGIDTFKARFGGDPTVVYNVFVANGLIGAAAIMGLKILGRKDA